MIKALMIKRLTDDKRHTADIYVGGKIIKHRLVMKYHLGFIKHKKQMIFHRIKFLFFLFYFYMNLYLQLV